MRNLVFTIAFQFAVKCHIVWSLSEPEESFWESYFSKGSTHQLSGAQDHPISTLSGTIASPYYPANFTLSPATNPGFTITIKTLGYRNIAIFYKTIEEKCEGLLKVNENSWCIPTSSSVDISSLQYEVYHTNYTDVVISLQSNSQTAASFHGYKIFYQMFTSRNSVLAADPPLYLPTIIATSDSFPALSEQLPISYNMKLNVHLYQSLDIRILLTDIGNSSCEEVYMLVYRTKLCIDRQNVTIDLSDHDSDSLTITIETDVAYTGVGMLVEISGVLKKDQVDMCGATRIVVYPSATTTFYNISGPGYPFTNSHTVASCQMQLGGYDLALISVHQAQGLRDCDDTQLIVGDKTITCANTQNAETFEFWGPLSTTLTYSQNIVSPQSSFVIRYQPLVFIDICQPGVYKNITQLPAHIRSPGLLSNEVYPPNQPNCYVIIDVPSATTMNVTIRILDLENSTSCRHDSLRIGSSLTLCGTKSPYSTLISVSTKFLVIFRSDSLIQKKGFAVTISDATPSPSTTVKTTSTMPSTPTIITEKTTPSVTMPTKKSIQTASTRSPKATDLTSTNKARTLSTVTEKSSQTKQESSTLHTKPTDKAEDISGKSKVRTTKTTPAYVWAIVAVLTISIGGIVAAVVIIQRRKRKSLLQYDNVNDDGDEVDLGFDNPTYGDEMQDL